MNQLTFSDIEYSNRKKKTKRGRKPIGIETMLRMYLMQIGFSLSDEGIEDSIYDSYTMRSFMHIDFNEQQVPDATTLLKFRHMLEANKLGEKIFADVNNRLDRAGLMIIHQQQTCIHKVKSRDHPYKGWLEIRAISPCY